ncbi:MAG TPA: hypothetical protein VFK30_06895 [Anaerolineae bacterium]|nr:hypothetical protein [Anaerolineae bacterium]
MATVAPSVWAVFRTRGFSLMGTGQLATTIDNALASPAAPT